MRIVVDEPKRLANLSKHGLNFDDAAHFDWMHCLIIDARQSRMKAIGKLAADLITIIFKRLGTEGLSIVGMRPASRKERRLYEQR